VLEAPDVVRGIHRAYADAGVDALTATTFRTQRHVLSKLGLEARAADLTAAAVRLARAGAEEAERVVDVLGSAPPLEDCYQPDLTPPEALLRREHARHAANLARAGVDAVWAETHPTMREAVAAVGAAREVGLPVGVCFVCDASGRLLSGEPLAEAVEAVSVFRPFAVGVNCLPVDAVAACLRVARPQDAPPWAVLANLGAPRADGGRSHDREPASFAADAYAWTRQGVRLVGGCCGTRPEHLAALVARLRAG
jgi:methionine synthase I (cobalamin-dependent)